LGAAAACPRTAFPADAADPKLLQLFVPPVAQVEKGFDVQAFVAKAAAAYLEEKGVPASQLIQKGCRSINFVRTNKTKEGRAKNRRVELVPAGQTFKACWHQ
jgi:hypothetical protein